MGNRDTILMSLGAALLGVLGAAAPTGLLVPNAEARVAPPAVRRRDEENSREDLLLVVAPRDEGQILLAGHESHRSHSSHSSHYSGSRGGSHYSGGGSYAPDSVPEPSYVPRPHRPKPAMVSFVAYPGGHIFVDEKSVGVDSTHTLTLAAGKHTIRIENRFLGQKIAEVELTEGQTGAVEIEW